MATWNPGELTLADEFAVSVLWCHSNVSVYSKGTIYDLPKHEQAVSHFWYEAGSLGSTQPYKPLRVATAFWFWSQTMVSENNLQSALVDWGLESQSGLSRKLFFVAEEFLVWRLKKRSEPCFHLANKALRVHSGAGCFSYHFFYILSFLGWSWIASSLRAMWKLLFFPWAKLWYSLTKVLVGIRKLKWFEGGTFYKGV